jgi:hypothetical protein
VRVFGLRSVNLLRICVLLSLILRVAVRTCVRCLINAKRLDYSHGSLQTLDDALSLHDVLHALEQVSHSDLLSELEVKHFQDTVDGDLAQSFDLLRTSINVAAVLTNLPKDWETVFFV